MAKKIIQDVVINKKKRIDFASLKSPVARKKVVENVNEEKEIRENRETKRERGGEMEFEREAREKAREFARAEQKRRFRDKIIFLKKKICFNVDLEADRKTSGKVLKIAVLSVVVLAVVGLLGKFIFGAFASVTIRISPHQENFSVNYSGVAAVNQKSDGKKLDLNIVQAEKEDSQTVIATGFNKTNKTASGKIIIYNTYTSKPVQMVAGTRFESSSGKIFKIPAMIYLPGLGSKEVTVYAEKAGQEYNIGLSDFTVPAYKGTSKYTTIYARSKTAMTGGALANSLIVSDKDVESAKKVLQEKIDAYLRKEVSRQVPADYILFKKAVKIDYEERLSLDSQNGSSAALVINGKATGFLVRRDQIVKELSKKYTGDENKTTIANLDELDFFLTSKNANNTEMAFNLRGVGKFVWNIDDQALIGELVSKTAKEYQEIFKKYPIEKFEPVFSPSWWKWMPKNGERIKVEKVVE